MYSASSVKFPATTPTTIIIIIIIIILAVATDLVLALGARPWLRIAKL